MAQWVSIATIDECPEGSAAELVAEGRVIALYCVAGQYFALDGICPHQGGPLGQGRLTGCVVTCPWHGWQYDVRTGQHQSIDSLKHRSYPVKVEGRQILVDIDA